MSCKHSENTIFITCNNFDQAPNPESWNPDFFTKVLCLLVKREKKNKKIFFFLILFLQQKYIISRLNNSEFREIDSEFVDSGVLCKFSHTNQ